MSFHCRVLCRTLFTFHFNFDSFIWEKLYPNLKWLFSRYRCQDININVPLSSLFNTCCVLLYFSLVSSNPPTYQRYFDRYDVNNDSALDVTEFQRFWQMIFDSDRKNIVCQQFAHEHYKLIVQCCASKDSFHCYAV